MSIKLGKSLYIATGQLNKLNKPVSKNKHLDNLYEILKEAFIMINNGNYSSSKLMSKFPGKPYLKNTDFTKSFHVYTTIEPEIYFRLQTILKDLTGRVWEMDVFLDLLIGWFICSYNNKLVKPKMPFYRKKELIGKRFNTLKKFNRTFSPYYKNIMGDWNE